MFFGFSQHARSFVITCAIFAAAESTATDPPACAEQSGGLSGDSHSGLHQVLPQFDDLWQWTDTSNVYVLRSGDSALLFNFGDGEVVKHLQAIGVQKLEWVLLTDHHRENCQGLARTEAKGFSIAASSEEREILESPLEFRKWFPQLNDKYSVYGASYVRPPAKAVSVSKSLAPGETFAWKDYEIECMATPGTSPGGMSYIIRHAGQTIAVSGSVMHNCATMTNWYDSEWDYGFAKGVDTLIESVDRLIKEDIDVMLPSQGPVIRHADDQLEAYAKKLKRFRAEYVRGYPVFDKDIAKRDPISEPTPVPHINRVTPHLYKLSHDHQGRNFAIIVSDSGRGLVLDCGLFPKQTLEEIVVGMRQHLGLKQIDAFWISHMHGDHFLLGPMMKERYGAKAWTLDRIVDRCENPRRYDYAALVSAYGDGFDGMAIDRSFRDGESIEWEGYTIHVDWMPGQTEFGCCLWLDIDGKRIAFTGDNLFGSPTDVTQNGHEAVVARNSCILEEGYVQGSQYLLDLDPDIVMGSHSYVMPEPRAFLERYHSWSKRMASAYRGLLPFEHYEYGFDPYWVSAYPYRVDLSENKAQEVTITVRNFQREVQQHRIELILPQGITANPPVLDGNVPPKSRRSYQVTLTVDTEHPRELDATGVQMAPLNITLDRVRYGQLFDFLVRLPE